MNLEYVGVLVPDVVLLLSAHVGFLNVVDNEVALLLFFFTICYRYVYLLNTLNVCLRLLSNVVQVIPP